MGSYVESVARKLGFKEPALTPEQMAMSSCKFARLPSRARLPWRACACSHETTSGCTRLLLDAVRRLPVWQVTSVRRMHAAMPGPRLALLLGASLGCSPSSSWRTATRTTKTATRTSNRKLWPKNEAQAHRARMHDAAPLRWTGTPLRELAALIRECWAHAASERLPWPAGRVLAHVCAASRGLYFSSPCAEQRRAACFNL